MEPAAPGKEDDSRAAGRYLVGDLVLDTGRHEVIRDGAPLELPKLSYRLLRTLVEASPNVLTHDELVKGVWDDRIVSPETVTQRVKLLRQKLGDDAADPRYIRVVRGTGYALIPDVESLPSESSGVARGLVSELGRRRVLQAALVYAAIAWSITEVLSFLIDSIPVFPAWAKSLVAILFVVGFPVAMFLAWRFDMGRDGLRRTAATSRTGKLTIGTAMLLLIGSTAGIFYLVYPSVMEDTPGTRASVGLVPNSVAVLPFANQSANDDDLYLSNGVSDDLRDQLGKMSDLRVAARSSSVSFGSNTTDALSIAERLRVSKLVEGRWWREGDSVRINVHIIDGATGFSEWSADYAYASSNLLGIQERLSNEVIAQLLPDLDESERTYDPATLNASANELMLLARHYFHQVQEASVVDLSLLTKAIELYKQATIIDPTSAEAHARLGAALLYLGDVKAAEEPIFEALTLDPTLSEAHNSLGLYYWMQFEPGAGEEHWRAIELNPNNADALENYGKWLWHQQETEEVIQYFLRALDLDPMSLKRYLDLGHLYGISNMRDEALDIADQIRSRFDTGESMMALARIHELTGDLDLAIAWAIRALEREPDDPFKSFMVAEMYARIGMFDVANDYEQISTSFNLLYWTRDYERMIDIGEERVLSQPNQVQIWYGLGRAYAATGRYDQAIYTLQSQNLPHNALVDSRRANGLEALVTLSDALNETGSTELAREYAEQARIHFATLRKTGAGDSWWPNLYDACLSSILDENDRAMTSLERVTRSNGLLWYPLLMDAPCFQKFKNDRTYQEVVAHYENRLAELRARLPGTLARFREEDRAAVEAPASN